MKASAAFATGLWIGAGVVAALGAFHFRIWERAPAETSSEMSAALQAKSDQVAMLEQDKARLTAEIQRLRETIADLRTKEPARAITESESPAVQAPGRVPFRRTPAAPAAEAAEPWIEEAVAVGDVRVMPQLEELAMQNNESALEALALMAELDGGAALMRVWSSDGLSVTNRLTATRYLAATMELSAEAKEMMRRMFADPRTDPRFLYAAVEGIANPNFPVTLGSTVTIAPPPHFRPDYSSRVELLDRLRQMATDRQLRAYLDRSREELLVRWAQAVPGGS
jgi:hypothetical protein